MKTFTALRQAAYPSLCVLALVVTACGGNGAADVAAPVAIDSGTPNTISTWDATATTTINQPNAASGTPEEMRAEYAFDLASVHVAMYDAVIAIAGGYRPFLITPTAPTEGASQDVAAAAAAYGVLKGLYPARTALYQAAYDSSLAAATDTAA
ncbi:MAG: hypothetical protein M3Z16_06100, partial [Pseudomonadota bacterium]|nr:hypothetical protein [Pseudomonadota bacterium]